VALTALESPPGGFEVVVVDDGGGAPLEAALDAARGRADVSLVAAPHRGPASARNAGAARAHGRLLAFTDDDCLVDPGWLLAFDARLAGAPSLLVGGRTLNGLPENPFSSASQSLIDSLYGYYNASPDQARFFASNNVATSRERFEAIGGFDESFPLAAGEDRDLCDRQRHAGGGLAFVPEAVVTHHHRLGLAGFVRQHFNYGRGARRYHERRAQRRGEAFRVEPPRFYFDLLRHPFRVARGRRAAVLLALTVLAQAANAAGFLRGAPSRIA
jgi:GT2 family glycosyltransferase